MLLEVLALVKELRGATAEIKRQIQFWLKEQSQELLLIRS